MSTSKRYMSKLRKLRRTRNRKQRKKLKGEASRLRRKMVSAGQRRRRNRHDVPKKKRYPKDLPKRMPKKYKQLLQRALRTKSGRAALRRYRRFTGLPWPTEIYEIQTPGRGARTLVGLGITREVDLASKRGGKQRKKRMKGIVACTADGRQLMILTGRDSKAKKQRLRNVGYVARTHYEITRLQGKAGSPKRNTHWVHTHSDDGGTWPEAYMDQAGNLIYEKGGRRKGSRKATYKVTDWIER